jgi:DNA-binding response OmpR family regulator
VARILLVEDNPDLAAGIDYNLHLEGYEVRIAPTGRDAIAAYAGWHPDLVLLDLMLPDIDG